MVIPYDQIDIEIRRLVWLVNQFEGVQTVSSCAGHAWPSPEAGISFTVDSQEHLANFVSALPPLGWRGGMVANLSQWSALTLTLDLFEGGLTYSLNFDGYPRYIQRTLIGDTELKLESALALKPELLIKQ